MQGGGVRGQEEGLRCQGVDYGWRIGEGAAGNCG